jgi:isocitrate lyase
MSATGNRNHAQPTTSNQIEHPLSDRERVAQYALAQAAMNQDWVSNPRWKGIERPYTAEDVLRLRGSIHIEHTLARMGAERMWELLQTDAYINALGAMTGNQAVQQHPLT